MAGVLSIVVGVVARVMVAVSVGVAPAGGLAAATRPASPDHAVPLVSGSYRYGRSHHDYPATDLAVACGTPVVALVTGTVWEVQRVDRYSPVLDIPGTRGGRTVVIDGDDGVRYLYAHLSTIRGDLHVGQRVSVGEALATVGSTGRSTGCHLHLGISPPCPTRVWDVLAGSVWPWPYLDAWRAGENLGPAAEVRAWAAQHPGVCDGTAILTDVQGTDVAGEVLDLEPPLTAREP